MTETDPPILPWRFAAGTLLHLALPAYLVTLAAALVINGEASLSAATVAAALSVSWQFLVGYSLLIAVVALGAKAIDPVLRRRRTTQRLNDPATAAFASERRVARAVLEAQQCGSTLQAPRILAAASLLRDGRWNHFDPRFQSLSVDFAGAAAAFTTASRTALMAERYQIAELAADALDQIAAELTRLSTESRGLDIGDAQVAARYIAMRYGPSDFAGEHHD